MLQTKTKKYDAVALSAPNKPCDSALAAIEDLSTLDFNTKVGYCFNDMINGNITDEELIAKYGQEVFAVALDKEMEYIRNLD